MSAPSAMWLVYLPPNKWQALAPHQRPAGLNLGLGVFTTGLVWKGRLQYAALHFDRLETSMQTLGLGEALPRTAIERQLAACCNDLQPRRLRIRIAERGENQAPEVSMQIDTQPAQDKFAAFRLALDRTTCRPSTNLTSRHKTLSYLDSVYAVRRAKAKGFDDALLLNEHGRVACAGFGNLFFLVDDLWVTPRISEGALPGIMRHVFLRRAEQLTGFPALETVVSMALLSQATAVAMSNSLQGVRQVAAIDDLGFSESEWPVSKGIPHELINLVKE